MSGRWDSWPHFTCWEQHWNISLRIHLVWIQTPVLDKMSRELSSSCVTGTIPRRRLKYCYWLTKTWRVWLDSVAWLLFGQTIKDKAPWIQWFNQSSIGPVQTSSFQIHSKSSPDQFKYSLDLDPTNSNNFGPGLNWPGLNRASPAVCPGLGYYITLSVI
jgi:hypothetical protein